MTMQSEHNKIKDDTKYRMIVDSPTPPPPPIGGFILEIKFFQHTPIQMMKIKVTTMHH